MPAALSLLLWSLAAAIEPEWDFTTGILSTKLQRRTFRASCLQHNRTQIANSRPLWWKGDSARSQAVTRSRRSIIAVATLVLFVRVIKKNNKNNNNNKVRPPAHVSLWWWRKLRQRRHFVDSGMRALQQARPSRKSGPIKNEKTKQQNEPTNQQNASSNTFATASTKQRYAPTQSPRKKTTSSVISWKMSYWAENSLLLQIFFFPIKMIIRSHFLGGFFFFIFLFLQNHHFPQKSSFWLNWNWIITCLFRKTTFKQKPELPAS